LQQEKSNSALLRNKSDSTWDYEYYSLYNYNSLFDYENITSSSHFYYLKVNFDIVVKSFFSIKSVVISNDKGEILYVCIAKLSSMNVNMGEVKAPLLASNLVVSFGKVPLILEWDFIIVIMAIKNQYNFFDWQIVQVIRDIISTLSSLQYWDVHKGTYNSIN